MLCVIVLARARAMALADATYRDALAAIDAIVGLETPHPAPVKRSNLRMRLRPSAMWREAKGLPGPAWRNAAPVLVRHLLQALTFWLGLRSGGFDPERYRQDMTLNADFRKVSGALKLILDCSPAQADAIEAALAERRASGVLDYGLHRAREAIMTCVTPDVDNHEHVHYVDGNDGGWWNAARGLKAQLREHEDG